MALLARAQPLRSGESGVTRLKNLGVSHGNAQRTVDNESDMRLGTLDQVAEALGLKSWQLLVEGLDADRPPRLADAKDSYSAAALRVAAIYDRVTRKDRLHIDAAADAASSPDDPPEAATDSDAAPLLSPRPAPAPPR